MGEYIISDEQITENRRLKGRMLLVLPNIVRCRDCRHYYEADNYHPNGNYIRRCCKYFDSYNDEVEPNGFCAWGERSD